MFSAYSLKQQADALGFNLVGILRAAPSPHLAAFFRWLERGQHGTLGYMAREDRIARRRDPSVILPAVRSIIMVGVNYHTTLLPPHIANDPSRGRIAAYAWGQDYHDVLLPRLEQLAAWLRSHSAEPVAHRAYVDTGAILERSHAQQAGLGFIGKNTMLIHPRHGSYFFLGDLLTDLDFDIYDTPHRETLCGTCTRCSRACPTDALSEPYVLDARRCISYLTIEHKGWLDRDLRPLMGNWIMGCDICQDVCPFTRFSAPTQERSFYPSDIDRVAPPLVELLQLTDEDFNTRFAGTPIHRLKRERLVRNACIAAGNWGSTSAAPALERLLTDHSALLRGHAAWALGRIGGSESALSAALTLESDDAVRAEITLALN
ncbi:MAG: tRNA epoxyqueuosine(34) reductase QueG [Anaerolineae bacterium]|nr:tRNA epoxyqueuosine(34) reductase QueG [Anaerolineae bacterium]